MGSSGSGQLMTTLVTYFLLGIPLAIMNSGIAARKGKSGALYGWLSVIPVVGFFIAYYLISLTDADLSEKIDMILERLDRTVPSQTENGGGEGGSSRPLVPPIDPPDEKEA